MPDWRDLAECARRGLNFKLFFPEKEGMVDFRVIESCRSCPVIRECRSFAIKMEGASYYRSGFRDGIWGGMTPRQRSNFARTGNETTIFSHQTGAYKNAISQRDAARGYVRRGRRKKSAEAG